MAEKEQYTHPQPHGIEALTLNPSILTHVLVSPSVKWEYILKLL